MLNIFGLDALIFLSCLIAAAKGSMKTAKSEGESGQPCPLGRLKFGEV